MFDVERLSPEYLSLSLEELSKLGVAGAGQLGFDGSESIETIQKAIALNLDNIRRRRELFPEPYAATKLVNNVISEIAGVSLIFMLLSSVAAFYLCFVYQSLVYARHICDQKSSEFKPTCYSSAVGVCFLASGFILYVSLQMIANKNKIPSALSSDLSLLFCKKQQQEISVIPRESNEQQAVTNSKKTRSASTPNSSTN